MVFFLPCSIAFGGILSLHVLNCFHLKTCHKFIHHYGSSLVPRQFENVNVVRRLSIGLEMWCMFMLDRLLLSLPRIVSVCGLSVMY